MMDSCFLSWGELPWVVRTGGNGFERANNGMPFWKYLQARPSKTLSGRRRLG